MALSQREEKSEDASVLTSVYPEQKSVVDTDGVVLNLLCSKDAAPLIEGDGDSYDLTLKGAAMRNDHLEFESGARICVTVADDIYTVARNDILSGMGSYDLYAAEAAGGLVRLLSEGALFDFSNSEHINLDSEHYDKRTNESLSLFGGSYLISSAISDARWWSDVLVCNNDFGGESLQELAKSGDLTLESLLNTGGVLYTKEDIYPLWFAVGGSFVRAGGEEPSFVSLSEFSSSIERLSPLAECEKNNVFTLRTLYECKNNDGLRIIPLPKAQKEDSYSGYVDLSEAIVIAAPVNIDTTDKSLYLFDRMAALSLEYVSPYFENCFKDKDLVPMITDSATCDASVLFGYGDMDELVFELMENDTRLNLSYYNRKDLYTKALSIIKKRLPN